MEFFLHPWYMVAGGALVSAPILIHLINRMRFKRIRWAAMEFLLRSQKRNRRRLIIEQLILLLLRILLVLLAAFLVARFVQAGLSTGQGAMHVVLLDDSLSMADRWSDKGQTVTSFDQAKEEIKKIAKEAALANSAQQLKLILLSDLKTARFDQRLNDTTVRDLGDLLKELPPSALHLTPLAGIEKARTIFNDAPQTQRILHVVSDFRDLDWSTGPAAEKLAEEVDKLTADGINLSLLDCAHPFRGGNRDVVLNHDNLAIASFRAESRVIAEGVPVEFTVVIQNYSPSEKKAFLRVSTRAIFVKKDEASGTRGVNRHELLQEDFAASQPVASIPPGKPTEVKFSLVFAKKGGSGDNERSDKKFEEPEFIQVRAEIDAEEAGLQGDNARDLVVEIRKRVPALVIDGNGSAGRQPGGDVFHLEEAFRAARSYAVEVRPLEDLERLDLDRYPSVVLLNVPEIKSEKGLQNLQSYVKRGGNLAYFLGDRVKPTFYNETLHRKYEGLFPVLLAAKPTEPLTPEEREERKQKDPQPKILFRDPKHPLVAELAKLGSVYRWLLIERHFPTAPRFQWEPIARESAIDLVSLPNRQSIDDYKQRAQELVTQVVERIKEVAASEPDWDRYAPVVDNHYRRQVKDALSTPYLYHLVVALDNLLNDLGVEKDPQRPNMPDLWNHPGMASLKVQIKNFRDSVLFGDPLVVALPYGRGRVVACMTSAGTNSVTNAGVVTRWNEWGGGNPASFTYPIFMMDLQRFLTSESEGLNRTVGDTLALKLEASHYLPKARRKFFPQADPTAKEGADQGEQTVPLTGEALDVRLVDTRRQGVYVLELYPIVEGALEQPVETRAFAFNVDSAAESDLRRAARDRLERNRPVADTRTGKVALRSPGDNYDAFKNRMPDVSESPWLYLMFLLILVVEQALAVHLSFHLKAGEATMPAAVSAARMRPEVAA